MNENEQIEEMARVYEEARYRASETLGSMNEGAAKWYAKALYEAGYRKMSEIAECYAKGWQEIAREIFAEIERNMVAIDDADFNCFFNRFRVIGARTFAELKKKYTEVDEDA